MLVYSNNPNLSRGRKPRLDHGAAIRSFDFYNYNVPSVVLEGNNPHGEGRDFRVILSAGEVINLINAIHSDLYKHHPDFEFIKHHYLKPDPNAAKR